MAVKIPDWLFKKKDPLNSSLPDMSSAFSRYESQSPLQSALSQGQMPAAQFGRLQTPASPIIEGAPITDLSATQRKVLQPVPWLLSAQGEGPRSQQTPTSLQVLQAKQASLTQEEQNAQNILSSVPELFPNGVPSGVKTVKAAMDLIKQKQNTFDKAAERAFKIDKANKDRQARIDAADRKTSGGFSAPGSSPIPPGSVAATDTKIVAGKTFKKINGVWVQK